jgi:hypothetical protein
MHVGEPEIPSLEPIGQLGVIHAEAVQQRGLKVMHMHRIFDYVVAVVVGGAVDESRLDAAAGAAKAADTVGLYLNPPVNALVLSVKPSSGPAAMSRPTAVRLCGG